MIHKYSKSVNGKNFFLSVFLFLCGLQSTHAEVFARDYYDYKNKISFKLYLQGVGAGLGWSNAYLVERGQAKLFCAPEKVPLQVENYFYIIEKKLESTAVSYRDVPVEIVLLDGLIESFPCNQ